MAGDPRIAIVGMGGIFPGAASPDQLWANIRTGIDASRDVPAGRWLLDPDEIISPGGPLIDHVPTRRGYFVDPIRVNSSEFDLPPGLLDALDPIFHLTLHAGTQAWRSARTANVDPGRVGVILGNLVLPTEKASELARSILGRTFCEKLPGGAIAASNVEPLNRYTTGLPAGLLARTIGLGGGTFTLDAACASSLYALHLAAEELRAGRADAMLAGGVSRPDCLYTQMGFAQLRALSPSGKCAPFDASGDGLVVGEGAGIFVLKRLNDALCDGDHILAVLVAGGLSNDVGGGLLAPDSEGQLRAMRAAYDHAGWSPHDVDLIECHATGTPVGDAVELRSLRSLWGDSGWRRGQCVIGSVKSTVGHLLTAAGAAAVTKVLHALAAETLPPTANFKQAAADSGLDTSPFRVLNTAMPWARRGPDVPRRAAVSGFGFGGVNAHLLLEEWVPAREEKRDVSRPPTPVSSSSPQLIAVVGMDAHFGPWRGLDAFRMRVLGGGQDIEPTGPKRWWGVDESDWFRKEGLTETPFTGYFINRVEASAGQFRIPPRELEEMLPQQLLMLDVASRAVASAGESDSLRLRTGVFVGIGLDLNTTNYHFRWSVRGPRDSAGPPLTANRTMGGLGSIIASRIARELRLGGPGFSVSSEECSGLAAVQTAVRALQSGAIDQAVVGAVDLAGDVRAVLATHCHRPYSAGGKARPFDREADGPIIGEGAAAVVLKRLDDAIRDRNHIHAVICGVGASSGGGTDARSADDYRVALERAIAESGIDRSSVSYLETHGSADPGEDDLESEALARFFTGHARETIPSGSVKADIGHAGAAGGLASFVKACLCLEHEVIPALSNTAKPRGEFGCVKPARSASYWVRNRAEGARVVGISSIAVDGNCVHVLLQEYKPIENQAAGCVSPQGPRDEGLFVVEGSDANELIQELANLRAWLGSAPAVALESTAQAWLAGCESRPDARLAVAMVARNRVELLNQIDATSRSLSENSDRALPTDEMSVELRDRVFYSPAPLGRDGEIAFVYPGSGNDFPGMGRDLALWRPAILRQQDAENATLRSQIVADKFWTDGRAAPSVRERIFAQVALGSIVTDLLLHLGVRPAAALGYSLGESAALFALRAWRDRDAMLASMNASPLFESSLAGSYDAARKAWQLTGNQPVEWTAGIIDRGADDVRAALTGLECAYLLLINTPCECVIGGEKRSVEQVISRLSAKFFALPNTQTVHCPIANEVADQYREFHRLPTSQPAGIRFYSAASGRSYDLTQDAAAEAILAQALDTVDFPAVVEAAYRDGVRFFVEIGPGGSCIRMIDTILGDRPHRARAACVPGADNVSSILRLVAQLAAERVPIDWNALLPSDTNATLQDANILNGPKVVLMPGGDPFVIPKQPPPAEKQPTAPPPQAKKFEPASPAKPAAAPTSPPAKPAAASRAKGETKIVQPVLSQDRAELAPVITSVAAVQAARARAHEAYLRFADAGQRNMAENLAFQTSLLEALLGSAVQAETIAAPTAPPLALNREQCLEFATGSIAKVLGEAFADVQTFRTRVRLPDEPLMLVDRITALEGEPCSLGSGRVVTEHDVKHGAWYLDGGRIPTAIAVEAGQADLFLSSYLGIDFETRGLAVYRLLDAVVTFHRGLPAAGEVIRYDIHIDHFFRQGDTRLFRFHFEATVGGEPLLSMTDGCAGFFSDDALAAGKGIVHTALDRRPGRGIVPDDEADLPPIAVESYSVQQVEALRRGDAAACFGVEFAGVQLAAGLRLPTDRMRLVDRVTDLDPAGGRFGIGLIRATMDIDPAAWFLTCHFVDDQVMPGTLMYECCLHTLRIFLLRRGWIAIDREVVTEPVPGVSSRLKCRGQVTASTKTVTYEVTLKEIGYRPEPYAVADALMYADGKPIVEMTNLSVRLAGLDRASICETWDFVRMNVTIAPPLSRRPLFDKDRILAFAIGKPSEAFGEAYRIFDSERIIARLPGPPYQFLDRITHINAEPWRMVAGGEIDAEYDVPVDGWYFEADRQRVMPFAVLLEAALQPCGWLAAYIGSALTSTVDLSFRNLGGSGEVLQEVTPNAGALVTHVKITRVSQSAGMIIQSYEFFVRCNGRPVYRGETTFGFFPKEALARQVGIRDAVVYEPTAAEASRIESFDYPSHAPLPDARWRMIDRIEAFVPDGGPNGLGFIRGTKNVNPDEWFFKAHFYQDPVVPGSLGLESLLQLLKILAVRLWPRNRFAVMRGGQHSWQYRGQVIPTSKQITVTAVATQCDGAARRLKGDGFLAVDGRTIYKMNDFTLDSVDDGP
jgi:PfaB family protein